MSDVKQVIVMRTDLNMRKGKMIAQGAHASIAFLTNKMKYKGFDPSKRIIDITPQEDAWMEGRFTKICVRVDSEEQLDEIHAKATEAGLVSHLITDAGLTEFDGVPTKTCLAIGPDYSEKIDVITGDLKLL